VTTPIAFEGLLKETMGLDPASVGSAAIERAVRLRMSTIGVNEWGEYWDTVRQSNDELQELIEAVVVPETWFFRDREAFTVLARLILHEWLPNHPIDPLRLLSGPCCTGEEPYSMAMALLDAGLSRESLQVDAVDISTRALTRARQGVYGQNSFRGEQLSFRDRYFETIEKGYRLQEWVRKIVRFSSTNLLSAEFGTEVSSYDVIFCRNVLIYFDHNTQQRVLKKLNVLLKPEGFLFVGPAETFLAASSGFSSVNQSMSFAFRKSSASYKGPTASFQLKPVKGSRDLSKKRIAKIEPPPQPSFTSTIAVSTTSRLDQAKMLADAGQLIEAAELCESHLKHTGTSFEVYYLLGVVRDSMGDVEAAAQCYRKALYLKPTHCETLTHLALLSERKGDRISAQKLHERARRAAKEHS
jgi:chemotaxis protein methyltransferase WspC